MMINLYRRKDCGGEYLKDYVRDNEGTRYPARTRQ